MKTTCLFQEGIHICLEAMIFYCFYYYERFFIVSINILASHITPEICMNVSVFLGVARAVYYLPSNFQESACFNIHNIYYRTS